MGDDYPFDSRVSQMIDAGFDGTIEATPGLPNDEGTSPSGPFGNIAVVADHGHG